MSGKSDDYEALVEATCDGDGTPLRAPTADDGLAPRCRDSFFGRVHLQVSLSDSCSMPANTAKSCWCSSLLQITAPPLHSHHLMCSSASCRCGAWTRRASGRVRRYWMSARPQVRNLVLHLLTCVPAQYFSWQATASRCALNPTGRFLD